MTTAQHAVFWIWVIGGVIGWAMLLADWKRRKVHIGAWEIAIILPCAIAGPAVIFYKD